MVLEFNYLKAGMSPGEDEIYAGLLAKCKSELSCPVNSLLNNSVKSGMVQKFIDWHMWYQYLKVERKKKKSNCKPVCLTSAEWKILESVIANRIREHLEKHRLVTLSQHGFLEGFSCFTTFFFLRSV